MNRISLLAILLSVTLFSCKDNKQNDKFVFDYEVYKTKEILLTKEDTGQKLQLEKQLVNIDGRDVIILNMSCKYLSFYDIENGEKMHEIFVDSLGMMRTFHFIGKDSIFIGCLNNYAELEFENPQALRLIDWDGNVNKVYGYDIDQNELNNYKYDIKKLVPPLNDEFVFCRGNIISSSTYSISYNLLGTKESVENPLPLGIRMDTKENKYHISKHRKYAYIKEGMYYPTNCMIKAKKTANDLPIFRYLYSSSAFEWDFENDNVIEHYFKSAIADSIMPLPSPAEFGHEVPYSYGEVKYDECHRVYVSPIFFNKKIYGEWKHGLIFADKDFQYIGELFDNQYYPSVSNNDILLNIRRTNDSTITLIYLKLVKTNRDYNTYIDSCRNLLQTMKQNLEDQKNTLINGCPPINFVKSQMEIKELSYKILTIHCSEGCPGCVDAAIYTLLENKEILNKVPLYLVISANNSTSLNSYIEQTGLSYFDKIVPDSTGIMKTVAKTGLVLNPRITVVKDGKVTLDTIYQAMDIEDKLLPQITGPDENSKYALDEDGEVYITTKQ